MLKTYTISRIFTLVFLAFFCQIVYGQNVGINSTGAAPNASAGLDVSFTDKGFLAPRMTAAQRGVIPSPATGLLVYQTDGVTGFYYYNGSTWVYNGSSSQWTTSGANIYYASGNVGIGSSSTPNYALTIGAVSNPLFLSGVQEGSGLDSILLIAGGVVKKRVYTATASTNAWSLTGNTGQSNTYNSGSFIGNTDANALRFRTSNLNRMFIDATGNVAIGANPTFAAAPEKLLVDAGTTSSYNVISGKGTINNYLQLNIQNLSNGSAASSDIVATANNGTESTNYVDLGINSSGNTSNYFGGANDAYLYNMGQDLLIGTGTAGKHLAFLTGGGTQSTNERMRIEGTGKIGIGTKSPDQLLDVNGNVSIGDSTETGKIQISNLAGILNNASDIYVSEDKMLRLSNSGVGQTGASLQLKNSDENYLFSFEGRGGFRYYSRNTLAEKFRVNDGGDIYLTTDDQNTAVDAKGNIDDFYQLNVQNKSNGDNASTDIIATANNGNDDGGYIDMGINSDGYDNNLNGTSNILNGANVTYLYGNGANMFIGNASKSMDLVFFTNGSNQAGGEDARGTERMRIRSTGQVGIGMDPLTTNNFSLFVSKKIQANGVEVTSDRRLKKNINNLEYGLKDLLNLRPVTYNWIDPNQSSNREIGLIAQDAKSVIPEIVSGNEEKEMMSVNYTALVPVLINAIKEQQAQIEELKQQIQKLQK